MGKTQYGGSRKEKSEKKNLSYQNDLILDPFNGVGTTTKVAHELKRNYLGIDNAKKYCNIAKKRITTDLFNGIKNKKIARRNQ